MFISARLTGFLLAAAWLSTAKAVDICSTIETCEAPGERACTCAARSAGSLYFYWRIPVASGHRYVCTMQSPFHTLSLPALSHAPGGATLDWERCCAFVPAVVRIDTEEMTEQAGDVIIKFEVPPSDIPTQVHIACDFDEEI